MSYVRDSTFHLATYAFDKYGECSQVSINWDDYWNYITIAPGTGGGGSDPVLAILTNSDGDTILYTNADTVQYVVMNVGDANLTWTSSASINWWCPDNGGSTLSPDEADTVTAIVYPDSVDFTEGIYEDYVVFDSDGGEDTVLVHWRYEMPPSAPTNLQVTIPYE